MAEKPRVLIFDDDLFDLRAQLARPSLHISLYDRADDCLTLVETWQPNVVLMDFHMRSPLKGDQAVRLLRDHFGPDLLIIGISSAPSLNLKLLQAGANRAHQKNTLPALLEDLAEELTFLNESDG